MKTKTNKAFLLIEALITVVVVAGTLLFINQAFTSSMRVVGLSSDYLKAILLLEDKSFDFEFEPVAETGEYSGGEEFMQTSFAYTEKVEQLGEEELGDDYTAQDLSLLKLQFDLSWKKQNVPRSIGISTYVMQAADETE